MLRLLLRPIVLLLLLCVGILTGACTPESMRSLPDEQRVAADSRLIGTWHTQVLGNDHVAVVTAGAVGTLDVVLRTRPASGGGDGVETRHRLSFYDIDGTRVIVERGPGLVDRQPTYRFAAYDVAPGGAVTLRYASQLEFLRWVMPLRLSADVRSPDPMFRDLMLTASSENLLTVLRSKKPDVMFDVVFGPFVRQ